MAAIEIRKVTVGDAIAWLKTGWEIFTKDWKGWMLMIFLYGVATIVVSFVPFVGPLAVALISPVIAAGFLSAAQKANRGEQFTFQEMFAGFQKNVGGLLAIGGLFLAAQIALAILGIVLVGGAAAGLAATHAAGGSEAASMSVGIGLVIGGIIFFVIAVIMYSLVAMASWFATPLVFFDSVAPLEAFKFSFRASLSNFLPLLVYGIIVVVLSFVAMLPIMLGFLVLGPVLVGTIYASYQSIFAGAQG